MLLLFSKQKRELGKYNCNLTKKRHKTTNTFTMLKEAIPSLT